MLIFEAASFFESMKNEKGVEEMDFIPILVGLVFLVWPLAVLPELKQNKEKTGSYFTDKRIFVLKATNFGSGLNQRSRIGFGLNVLLGGILTIVGILRLF
jgi:hypothetical protein